MLAGASTNYKCHFKSCSGLTPLQLLEHINTNVVTTPPLPPQKKIGLKVSIFRSIIVVAIPPSNNYKFHLKSCSGLTPLELLNTSIPLM